MKRKIAAVIFYGVLIAELAVAVGAPFLLSPPKLAAFASAGFGIQAVGIFIAQHFGSQLYTAWRKSNRLRRIGRGIGFLWVPVACVILLWFVFNANLTFAEAFVGLTIYLLGGLVALGALIIELRERMENQPVNS